MKTTRLTLRKETLRSLAAATHVAGRKIGRLSPLAFAATAVLLGGCEGPIPSVGCPF